MDLRPDKNKRFRRNELWPGSVLRPFPFYSTAQPHQHLPPKLPSPDRSKSKLLSTLFGRLEPCFDVGGNDLSLVGHVQSKITTYGLSSWAIWSACAKSAHSTTTTISLRAFSRSQIERLTMAVSSATITRIGVAESVGMAAHRKKLALVPTVH
jgi:hypothetical protein